MTKQTRRSLAKLLTAAALTPKTTPAAPIAAPAVLPFVLPKLVEHECEGEYCNECEGHGDEVHEALWPLAKEAVELALQHASQRLGMKLAVESMDRHNLEDVLHDAIFFAITDESYKTVAVHITGDTK